MKRVFFLSALVATVFASNACGKKDDSKPQEQPKNSFEQKLIGKWSASLEIEVDAQGNKLAERESKCFSFEFFAGGKGNWLLDSDAICQDGNNWTKREIGWEVQGNNLVVHFTNNSTTSAAGFEIASVEDDYLDLYVYITDEIKDFYHPKMNKVIKRYLRNK